MWFMYVGCALGKHRTNMKDAKHRGRTVTSMTSHTSRIAACIGTMHGKAVRSHRTGC